MYVKKPLQYENLVDLECSDVQSLWIRAAFKNCRQVYYPHVYREHLSTLGDNLSSQGNVLEKLLLQWERALAYGNISNVNEVHISGAMNLDTFRG